ncbi:hypothetical protein [Streptomyces sp. NBC_00459]|uniref:hypothetical protein n=1 Tax=Streptomyces sp. NBC_00459 TaxID=2975749 RepID=UPI002E177358
MSLSIYNLVLFHERPAIKLSLPHVLRVGQNGNAYFFMQLTIAAPKKTEDLEIVTDVDFQLNPEGKSDRSPRARFWWDEVIRFKRRPEDGWEHAGDPNPFVIAQDKPQMPFLSFVAEDWKFAAGEYKGTLTLHRASGQQSLIEEFCLIFTQKDIEELAKEKGEDWWYPYRNDDPSGSDQHGDCYVRWSGY